MATDREVKLVVPHVWGEGCRAPEPASVLVVEVGLPPSELEAVANGHEGRGVDASGACLVAPILGVATDLGQKMNRCCRLRSLLECHHSALFSNSMGPVRYHALFMSTHVLATQEKKSGISHSSRGGRITEERNLCFHLAATFSRELCREILPERGEHRGARLISIGDNFK